MGQFAVLKEVYTIDDDDDTDHTDKKIPISIDEFDPLCASLPQWTMAPQVSAVHNYTIFLII